MFDWLKGKFKKKPETTEGEYREVPEPESPEDEDIKRAREAATKRAKIEWASQQAKRTYEEELKKQGAQARREAEEAALKEHLEKLPKRERKRFEKKYEQTGKKREEAAFEIWEAGAPEKVSTIQKVWVSIPGEPFGGHYEFREVTKTITPYEQLALARAAKADEFKLRKAEEEWKGYKRERSLPFRAARAAGGFGQFMAGTAMLGVAGAARGIQPGRGGPQRAARMLAPSLPLDLYGVRPMLGVGIPTAKSLTGAGLGRLRSMTLPSFGAQTQVRRTPLAPKPKMPDLSRLRRRL